MEPMTTSFGMLRCWNDEDLEALVKYANNRKIWLNLRDGFVHPYTQESGRAFLAASTSLNPVTRVAIATPEEAIGSVGISLNQDVHRLTAELGYWLAEPYWGKGIMTEAIIRYTDYAFEEFKLVRIYAEPYAWNQPSCRVLEKAGFVLEGRLKNSVIKDGQVIDQFMYAKTREQA